MNIQKTIYNVKLAVQLELHHVKFMKIVAVVIFAFPLVAWSQKSEWTVYNTANSGLPYNGVSGLAVDKQGNIWIGTGRWYAFEGGGLALFDGENWTVYNTGNSGLPNNDHTGLAVDDQGNVWIGTEGGTLVKFDGENWTSYGSPTSSGQLASPSFDAQGNLWVGSYGGGLVKLEDENWTVYRAYNSGLPHDRAWATAIDAQGHVWIGTAGGGVAKFDGIDNWTVYNTSNSGLPYNDAAIAAGSLAIDAQGNIWIGTAGGGLAKFDGVSNWTVYKTSNSGLPYNNAAGALAIDGKGNVWVGTWGGGLAKFDGENWTVYKTSNSGLPNNRIYSLAIDAQNNVWIGTESGGLAVYRGEAQSIFDLNGDGIVDSADMCIIVDHWGENYTLCDIAPAPLGDGTVDIQDLILLSAHLFEEGNDLTLIAHWTLDEAEGSIAQDSTNNNDGTVYGDPAWQPDGGLVDGALLLDGIDDYVNTPRVLNPAYGKFSIFAWIKGGAPGQVVISQFNGADWLAVDPSLGCLMTNLRYSGRGGVPLQSQTIIADDTWHRIGFVWDGVYRALYVDDILVAEDTQNGLGSSIGGLNMGCGSNSAAGTFWSGLIDDVRIYNRVVIP